MSGTSEHWLDRLAANRTRRQVLKAGLAGAAALTLPALRPGPPSAQAEQFSINVDPCFTGCKHFTHTQFADAKAACQNDFLNLGSDLFGFRLATGGIFAAGAQQYYNNLRYHRCYDTAMMRQKVALFNCSQATCSGFDPKQKGGPCETCAQNCCVCPNIPDGYICCYYDCNDKNHNCCGS